MVEKILMWIVSRILETLFGKAQKAIEEAKKDKERETQREETDEENTEKYQKATDRAERIKAAQDLLNGVRSPKSDGL